MMFVLQYHSSDEELVMAPMKDIILAIRPAGTFGSVATPLVPLQITQSTMLLMACQAGR